MNDERPKCPGCGNSFLRGFANDWEGTLLRCEKCELSIAKLDLNHPGAQVTKEGWSCWDHDFEFDIEGLASQEEALENLTRWVKLMAFK